MLSGVYGVQSCIHEKSTDVRELARSLAPIIQPSVLFRGSGHRVVAGAIAYCPGPPSDVCDTHHTRFGAERLGLLPSPAVRTAAGRAGVGGGERARRGPRAPSGGARGRGAAA